jgi:hypothetical protein
MRRDLRGRRVGSWFGGPIEGLPPVSLDPVRRTLESFQTGAAHARSLLAHPCPTAKPQPRSGDTFVDVVQSIQYWPRADRTGHWA